MKPDDRGRHASANCSALLSIKLWKKKQIFLGTLAYHQRGCIPSPLTKSRRAAVCFWQDSCQMRSFRKSQTPAAEGICSCFVFKQNTEWQLFRIRVHPRIFRGRNRPVQASTCINTGCQIAALICPSLPTNRTLFTHRNWSRSVRARLPFNRTSGRQPRA